MPKSKFKLRRFHNGNWQVDWGHRPPKIKDPRIGKGKPLGRYQQFRFEADAEEFAMMVLAEEAATFDTAYELSSNHDEKIDFYLAKRALEKKGFGDLKLRKVVKKWLNIEAKKGKGKLRWA